MAMTLHNLHPFMTLLLLLKVLLQHFYMLWYIGEVMLAVFVASSLSMRVSPPSPPPSEESGVLIL